MYQVFLSILKNLEAITLGINDFINALISQKEKENKKTSSSFSKLYVAFSHF